MEKTLIVFCVICYFLIGCGTVIERKEEQHKCQDLSVSVANNDTMDHETDSEYGVGDDDMFSASDFSVYRQNNTRMIDITDKVNDYNLTSSYKDWLAPNRQDTLFIVIDFKGLYSDLKIDTTVVITGIDIVNGDRYNAENWKNEGKIKNVTLLYNKTIVGCAVLRNTYKIQTVSLGSNSIVNHRGKADTISIVIESTYKGNNNEPGQYVISEIKLDGYKEY